ncbi:MAG: DUF664 domain-containing protein [Chloroflexi bacterium]|nr:DUF664 domain-containing protein [Chloroflexota bacterium]
MPNKTSIEIAQSDFLLFIDRAFDGMRKIIEELGDDLANQKPDIPGANSPYAIAIHCIGVVNHWVGNSIAGRGIIRDRDGEFTATGTHQEIAVAIIACRDRLAEDLGRVDGLARLAAAPPASYNPAGGPSEWTQGAAIIHAYEELSQHYGQMELTRDILVAQRP